jgi:hypothetical protein
MAGLALMPGGLESCEHAVVSRSILIVGDRAGFRQMARALLEAEGFALLEVSTTTGGSDMLASRAALI